MQGCLSVLLLTCKASAISLRKTQEEIENGGSVVEVNVIPKSSGGTKSDNSTAMNKSKNN